MLYEKSSSLLSTPLRHVLPANLQKHRSVDTEVFLCDSMSALRMTRTESRSPMASYPTAHQKPAGKR